MTYCNVVKLFSAPVGEDPSSDKWKQICEDPGWSSLNVHQEFHALGPGT